MSARVVHITLNHTEPRRLDIPLPPCINYSNYHGLSEHLLSRLAKPTDVMPLIYVRCSTALVPECAFWHFAYINGASGRPTTSLRVISGAGARSL